MELESQLTALTKKYLSGEALLDDLYTWVQDRQEAILKLPPQSIANQLAGAIMLAAVEKYSDVRDEESVRQAISDEYALLMGSRALP